jgi:hypothetical protein
MTIARTERTKLLAQTGETHARVRPSGAEANPFDPNVRAVTTTGSRGTQEGVEAVWNIDLSEAFAWGQPTLDEEVAQAKLQARFFRGLEVPELPAGERFAPTLAMIDGGFLPTAKLLRNRMWTNPLETSDGLDNDGNGYIDDLHGIDLPTGLATSPEALQAEHAYGLSFVLLSHTSKDVPVIPLSGMYEGNPIDNLERAALYLSRLNETGQANIRVVNMSFGIENASAAERERMQKALATLEKANILVVAAVSDAGRNLDDPSFAPQVLPAGLQAPNLLSVTALNRDLSLRPDADYGAHAVDLGVAGQSSPSFAAAETSAAAIRLLLQNPEWTRQGITAAELKANLLACASVHPELKDVVRSSAVLQVRKSLLPTGEG